MFLWSQGDGGGNDASDLNNLSDNLTVEAFSVLVINSNGEEQSIIKTWGTNQANPIELKCYLIKLQLKGFISEQVSARTFFYHQGELVIACLITENTCTVSAVPVPSIEEVARPQHVWDPRASQTQHTPSRSFVCGNRQRNWWDYTVRCWWTVSGVDSN